VDYNDVWHNAGGDYEGISPGAHDISIDPLLADPANGDFHLQPGSPCIDAGDPGSHPSTDFESDLRPMGAAADIGVDEYRSLGVVKTSIPDEASPGAPVTYAVRYFNLTADILTDVRLTDTLPIETAFVGYQADGLTCTHDGATWGGRLSCNLNAASLAPGESRELTMTVALVGTLPRPQWVSNPITLTASANGEPLISRDQAATWVSWCAVRLNTTPMGGDIQAAINASTQTADVIKVSGTCQLHDLTLNKTLILQGGWNRDFTERDPLVHNTTLDGRGLGRVIQVEGDVSPTIDGFAITRGVTNDAGGGISITSGSPIVQNNTFTSNYAGSGGGINIETGSPLIESNVFTGNYATTGAGLSNGSGSPVIQNNTFTGNHTYSGGSSPYFGKGGGLYIGSGSPIIQNNVFTSNSSQTGGGGLYNWEGNPTIQNNLFLSNFTYDIGGGMITIFGTPIIQNNNFRLNRASTGGGVALDTGTPIFRSNIVMDNIASTERLK
jgi:uncharacterized repeat protein (TIGR01451 family)